MEIVEVNTPFLFEKLKSLELKVWKGLSDIEARELLQSKRAYMFTSGTAEVGYLVYSHRKGSIYIEDLVVSDASYFIPIMRSIERIFKPMHIVALIEPHFSWFFSERINRILKNSGYKLIKVRRFSLFGESFLYVRLNYEGTSG
ncbi:MAG: hypothetical protein KNN13_06675 [Hydrogenobacter thermophilus]|uniref:hypothetical protein n=1 Tax=Hydrogenobacter thermophilus TaxID=940 RepID=UPI001C750800|nr:hypothetical protein [Hydrogenobacter thermophilus]QWK19185.1 MAG: hypothetical protein KNN13_06675 [Hydrogenobacter thermophilus]